MDATDRKAPIDPHDETVAPDADRDANLPPGTPTDPAEVVRTFVDPEAAGDPAADPGAGTQR